MRALRRFLFLAALLLAAWLPAAAAAADLQLYVLDVGQGEAMLVISPAGKTVLIDGGPPHRGQRVAARIKELVSGQLDLMIMTHPHADHLGGLLKVLDRVGTRIFMEPAFDHASPLYNELLKNLEARKVALKIGEAGRNIDLGGGASMRLLSPRQPPFDNTRSDANANSIVARLTYGRTAFYLAADSELETEKAILASGEEISADVYKVAHHGSRHSSSMELLLKIRPRIAVVSVGAGNEYGHPTRATLDRLESLHAEVLRTDLDGEILFRSDGERVTYTTEKGGFATAGGTTFLETKPSSPPPDPPSPRRHRTGRGDRSDRVDRPAKAQGGERLDLTDSRAPPPAVDTPRPASAGGYVASRNSQAFHSPDCTWAGRIRPENVVRFGSRDEAIGTGRHPCGYCKP